MTKGIYSVVTLIENTQYFYADLCDLNLVFLVGCYT